jgi:hypothetical protein
MQIGYFKNISLYFFFDHFFLRRTLKIVNGVELISSFF